MSQPPAPGPAATSHTMRRVVIMLGIGLAILHQDWWFKSDASVVFGFIPISLFYHLCFSVASAGLWALMSKFAWPTHIEEFAALGDAPAASAATATSTASSDTEGRQS